jgi:hypothetical protein
MTDHDTAEDERKAFWSAWIHMAIVWVAGLIVFTVAAQMYPRGLFHTALLALLAIFAVSVLKLAWEAVSFAWDCRRDAR